MKTLLAKIADGQTLTEQECSKAFDILTSGVATSAQIGAFLIGLRARGETIEEITGAARTLSAQAVSIPSPPNTIDVCGTGGDRKGTYNISTAVSFVVAACGVPVAKHGNRAISSGCGAADVLTALGVNINCDLSLVQEALWEIGVCFLMAPRHHQGMRHVGPARLELGTRTIFNLLGPLINPAKVKRQIIGVFAQQWVKPVIQVLQRLGAESAWVVHGNDGMDEITTTTSTTISQLHNHTLSHFEITPEDFGIPRAKQTDLKGGTPEENAVALKDLLNSKTDAYRDIVLVNSAAALMIAEKVSSLEDGIAYAAKAIDDRKAANILEQLIHITNKKNNS